MMLSQQVRKGLFGQHLKIDLSVTRQQGNGLPGFIVNLNPGTIFPLPATKG
jgi:hypothetical protein